jgi:hypothetical protein
VYSDSIGMCIFRMYSYRIYQKATQQWNQSNFY